MLQIENVLLFCYSFEIYFKWRKFTVCTIICSYVKISIAPNALKKKKIV